MSLHKLCLFKLSELEGKIETEFYETNNCHNCDGLNYYCPNYEPTSDAVIDFYLRK